MGFFSVRFSVKSWSGGRSLGLNMTDYGFDSRRRLSVFRIQTSFELFLSYFNYFKLVFD